MMESSRTIDDRIHARMTTAARSERDAAGPWAGIIPALVTPLCADGSLDVEGLERLIAHVSGHGVHAISILGSTGEGALLPQTLQIEALKVALRSDGRRAVIAGVLNAVPDDAFAMAERAFECGATAVLLTPPFYYRLDQASIVAFYREAVRVLRGPIFIYHIPSFTKVQLEPETVSTLAELPGLVGIKDSNRDLDFHRRVIELTRDRSFAVFAGSGDILTASMSWGGAGAIAASANLIPQALVQLWNALRADDADGAAHLHRLVHAVEEMCRGFPFPVNWKTSLALVGLISAVPAFPFQAMLPARTEVMRSGLRELGVLR